MNAIKAEKDHLVDGCTSCIPQMVNDPQATTEGAQQAKLILCATKTCPKCMMVKMFLDRAGLKYEVVYAEDNEEFFKANGIQEAPTLLVVKDDAAEKYANPSNIRKYIDSVSARA